MVWVFLIAGMTGILCGNLYRAPALIALSFISLGWVSVVLLLNGFPFGEALISAFLVTAVLQMGYLLGACCGNVRQYLRSRTAFYARGWFRIPGIPLRSRRWLIPNG